jgi:tRNA threonylcarbamoyladenosine biosynthesis protein TsaE
MFIRGLFSKLSRSGVLVVTLQDEIVKDEEGTERRGFSLASLFRAGDVIALYGELGAGKTCLVRGLAKGLGVENGMVSSPSFSLINEYPGTIPLFHMDCYRLSQVEELYELGLEEYFDGPGISIIEWAERIKDLPEERLEILITILDESRRRIRINGYGRMADRFKNWNPDGWIQDRELK